MVVLISLILLVSPVFGFTQITYIVSIEDSTTGIYIVPPAEMPLTLELNVEKYVKIDSLGDYIPVGNEVPVFSVVEERDLNFQGLIYFKRDLRQYYTYDSYLDKININVRITKSGGGYWSHVIPVIVP